MPSGAWPEAFEMPPDVYKMQEIYWRPGLRPKPHLGSLQHFPGLLAGGTPKHHSAFQASGLSFPRPIIFRPPRAKILVLFLVPTVLQPLTPLYMKINLPALALDDMIQYKILDTSDTIS